MVLVRASKMFLKKLTKPKRKILLDIFQWISCRKARTYRQQKVVLPEHLTAVRKKKGLGSHRCVWRQHDEQCVQ